ncbi:tyrosine-type recombinase/integrase [Halolamina rubra]|uniref:tyrosine-type recombinase/integrase n=1 Tax=Halolamina rubra TaxID=1380430 RepID=UPI0009E224DE|nr:tyrosine-type recombinase/integrase [Halolamina rubra]
MTDQPKTAIKRNVERCRERDGLGDADAEAILDAHHHMELVGNAGVSDSHHSDVLMRAVKIARETEPGTLAAALEDRDAAEDVVRWINRTYDNPETNRGYRQAFRAFGRHSLGVDELPECLDWVPAGYPSNYDPAPDPAQMLRWDDHIKPMLEGCNNVRDEALVALCWDLGPRTSELHELQVGNISEGDYGLTVTIENGKNGSRSPTIVRSVPFVRDWLERHPGDRDDYLWTRMDRPERVSRNYLRDALKNAARRVDLDLPATPTPTRFRKSSASYLASQNVNQAFLEDHHGWVTGSDKAARYITVFSDQSDRAIAEAHGVDVDVEDDGPDMVECVRCEALNDADRSRCRQCDQVLSQEAAEQEALVDRVLSRLDDQLLEADDRDERAELLEGKQVVEERRSDLDVDALHQLLSSGDA